MRRISIVLIVILFGVHQLIAQVSQITTGFSIQGGVANNNRAYFATSDFLLWISDGTTPGTLSAGQFNAQPQAAFMNGLIFFNGYDATNGVELWVSNGTIAGTNILKDINTGSAGSNPDKFYKIGNTLYFVATTAANGAELWKTDGTAGGTVLVKDINAGAAGSGIVFSQGTGNNTLNNILFFVANDGVNGEELWKSDGSNAGTQMVKNISAGSLSTVFSSRFETANAADVLFFLANDNINGLELWRTDGTVNGTFMVKDINLSGSSFFDNINYIIFNNKLYFGPSVNTALWVSDGTFAGTQIVANMNNLFLSRSENYEHAILYDDRFFFAGDNGTGSGMELWVSNGTTAGTTMFMDINPGSGSSNPLTILPAFPPAIAPSLNNDAPFQYLFQGNKFFFIADNGSIGKELWVSNGTIPGTHLVKDVNPGAASSFTALDYYSKSYLTVNNFFLMLDDGTSGEEPWITDGTQANTIRLADIYPGATSSNGQFMGVVNNNRLLFQASENATNNNLFKIDTTITTLPLKYVFIGNGNWSLAANWQDNLKPDASLAAGSQVIINPLPAGECIVDIPYTLTSGCKLIVTAGKKLLVMGNLTISP